MLHHGRRAALANSAAPSDAQFNYVTMLLHGDGTNGAQNNTFLDSSTNNYTITRNGNTTQGSYSPYGSLWSNYFVSTTETSLYNTSTALIGSSVSTFTMEAWMYMTVDPVNVGEAGSHGPLITPDGVYNSSTVYMSFGPLSDRKLHLQWFDGATKGATYNTALNLNQWYHVAVVVNAGAISMYVDGVSVTLTGNTTLTNRSGSSGNFCLGGSGQYQFGGYVSNVRVTTTAVYTGNFTPSTTPLIAVTGTVLLACQSNRFKDNSTNNYSLTPYRAPTVERFSPFNPTAPYSTATIGGSGYFDGSGDYLATATTSSFAFGTNNFTVEGWVYMTAYTDACMFGTVNGSTSGYYVNLGSNINSLRVTSNASGSWADTITVSAGNGVSLNTWTHIALVRNGSSLILYKNGVNVANTASAGSYNFTSPSNAGYVGYVYNGSSTQYFTGYIDDLRITKGYARYTSNFTAPTAALPTY